MANKNIQPDDEIIDLTELIESGQAATPAGAAASYARASQASSGPPDFEEMLAASEAGDSSPQSPVDPHEELDMSDMGDIDNLLESLDIPPQPRQAQAPAAKPAPKASSSADLGFSDLDSMLDDLMPEAGEKPAQAKAPAPDLDDLLSGSLPPKAGSSASPLTEVDADLDDILAEVGEPLPPPKPVEPEPVIDEVASLLVEEAPAAPDRENAPAIDELDALLDEGLAQGSPPEIEPVAPADDLEDFSAGSSASAEKVADSGAPGDMNVDESSMEEVAEVSVGTAVASAEDDFELADNFDAMIGPEEAQSPLSGGAAMDEALPAGPLQAYPPELIAGVCRGLIADQSGASQKTLQEFSRELGAQTAHVEDLGKQAADLASRMRDCETRLAGCAARLDGLEKMPQRPDALASGGEEGLKTLVAAAVGEALLAANRSQPGVGDIAGRVAALERESGAALASHEKLRESLSTGQASLAEDVSGLEQRLAALESRLNDLGTLSEAVVILENRVERLEERVEAQAASLDGRFAEMAADFDARLDLLENKLKEAPADMERRVESAAAAAAARLLREEIARLLADG